MEILNEAYLLLSFTRIRQSLIPIASLLFVRDLSVHAKYDIIILRSQAYCPPVWPHDEIITRIYFPIMHECLQYDDSIVCNDRNRNFCSIQS